MPLTAQDFDEAFNAIDLQRARVLTLSMAVAPLIYAFLGVFLAWTQPSTGQGPDAVFVSIIALLAATTYFSANWFADRRVQSMDLVAALRDGFLLKGGTRMKERGKVIMFVLLQHAMVRLALIEAGAVMGLMLAFMAGGLMKVDHRWLLTLAPCLVATSTILQSFPNKERMRETYKRVLQGRG